MRQLYGRGVIALIAALIATPVLSQAAANFDNLTLSPGFPQSSGVVGGNTGGSYSLSSIANSDRKNNVCFGYGDQTPDHIMILQQNFSNLNLQVNTGGKDTTLVIQGPNDQTIRCGNNTGSSKDASLKDNAWEAGQYKIWVGSLEPSQRWNYTLSVQE